MSRRLGTFPAEIPTTTTPNHYLRPSSPRNPLSPPSAPVQGRLQGPPAKSKFLAVLPTAKAPFGSDSFDPMIGFVYTHIQGRHGFNVSARYKFNTGVRANPVRHGDSKADILHYDTAYLYRLSSAKYTADTKGAWYAIAELHGTYETNGDHEFFLSPGVMYEARDWALEASISLPTLQEVDHRPHADYILTLGVRFLF